MIEADNVAINFGRELGDPWQYLAYVGAIALGAIVGWVLGAVIARWLPSRMRAIDRAVDSIPAPQQDAAAAEGEKRT